MVFYGRVSTEHEAQLSALENQMQWWYLIPTFLCGILGYVINYKARKLNADHYRRYRASVQPSLMKAGLYLSAFTLFGAMIMAFTIDVPSALIFAGVIPILLVVVFFIMLMSIPMFKRVQQKLDDVLHLTRQNLTGVRVIRAFCREKEAVAEFDKDNNALLKLNEKVGLLSAFMNPLTYAIINIATILLIQNGALRVSAGALSQGDVVALYNYMAQIVVELIKLASLIITIDKSLACAGRVSAILKMEEEMHYGREENKQDETVAIAFAHVTFTYEGSSAPSLEDISFTLDKG